MLTNSVWIWNKNMFHLKIFDAFYYFLFFQQQLKSFGTYITGRFSHLTIQLNKGKYPKHTIYSMYVVWSPIVSIRSS